MAKPMRVVLFIFLVATWSIVRGQEGDANSTADEQSQAEIRMSDDMTKYNNDERPQDTQQAIYRVSNSDYARRMQLSKLLAHMSKNQHEMSELARVLSLHNKRTPTTFSNSLQQNRLSSQSGRLAPMSRLDLGGEAYERGLFQLPGLSGLGPEDLLANEGVDVKPLSPR